MKSSHPNFIVGVGRSGTTLLSAILNRHSQIHVTPETRFFCFVYEYQGGIEAFVRDWPASLLTIAKKMDPTASWDPIETAKTVTKETGEEFPGLAKLFYTFCKKIANFENKNTFIEKTPDHLEYLPQIRALFPESKIIHLIRDGRAVAESRSRMDFVKKEHRNFIDGLLYWKRNIYTAKEFLKNDTNYLEIKYESLVSNPHETIAKILHFLGKNSEDNILLPDGSEHGLIENGTQHKANILNPIDPSLATAWKKRVSSSDMQWADILIGEELEKLNYIPQRPLPGETLYLCVTKSMIHQKNKNIPIEIIQHLLKKYRFIRLSFSKPLHKVNSRNILISDIRPPSFNATKDNIIIYILKHIKSILSFKRNYIIIIWLTHIDYLNSSAWIVKKIVDFFTAFFSDLILLPKTSSHNALLSRRKKIYKTDNKDYLAALDNLITARSTDSNLR